MENNSVVWESSVLEPDYPKEKIPNLGSGIFVLDDSFSNSKSVLNVTDAKYIECDSNTIKNAIKMYGAVYTGVMYASEYAATDANGDRNYFLSNNVSGLNHAVSIVGWDDMYSKDNFTGPKKPTIDGAWLLKDSSGENVHGKGGYIWLSYEDGSLNMTHNKLSVITGVQPSSNYEYMLSYDYLPIGSSSDYYTTDEVYFCNVYDVDEYLNVYDCINKVMVYMKTTGCTYALKIVQFSGDELPMQLDNYSTLATGEYSGEGYVTIDIENDYVFNSSDKCAVILQLMPNSSQDKIYYPNEKVYYVAPEINLNQSYIGFVNTNDELYWEDCKNENSYKVEGNFCIRPVLKDNDSIENDSLNLLSPTSVNNDDFDVQISIDTDKQLFSIHTSSYYILREDIHYTVSGEIVTIKKEYLQSLNGNYTELVFCFTDSYKETFVVNPKSVITQVTIDGVCAVGQDVTATCVGEPPKDDYDVTYQWQSSQNGNAWYNISGATSQIYTITENDLLRYIRVKVNSKRFGNVDYPSEVYSNSSEHKVFMYGDVNMDGVVDASDVTEIQFSLPNGTGLTIEQKLAADVNFDNIIDVQDVTALQMYLAGIYDSLPIT